MEDHHADREDYQCLVGRERHDAGGLTVIFGIFGVAQSTTRNFVVDGVAVDQPDADEHSDGHDADEPEHAFRLPVDRERRAYGRAEHIAGVVPGLVRAGLGGEELWPNQSKGDGGDRRGEKGAGDSDRSLRAVDGPGRILRQDDD